jgi:membrane protease subunit HflC
MMKKNIFTIITAGIILVILVLYLVAFQVRLNEQVVLTTFGKPVLVLSKPGLYWKWPWPIQSLYRFDSRLKVLDSKFEETYTRDGKNLIVTTSLAWRIQNPLKFLESVGTELEAEKNLQSILRNYKNAVIGRHPLNHLISTEPGSLQFDEIEEEMLGLVSKETELRYGVGVKFVRIKQMALPEDTTAKVFERMRKERERVAERYRAEGEGEANKIKAEAESRRDRILAMAEAEAKRIMGEGDALAAKSYSVFSENEELAIFLRKLDALRDTLKEKTTVVLDTGMPPYDLLEGMPELNE